MAADPNDVHDGRASAPILGARRAYRIAEFCRRYAVGRTKAYEEVKLGRLRARKIGRCTIITADDAEDWLKRLPLSKTPSNGGIGS